MLINGLKAGFNAIMYEDHSIPIAEFIEINKYLVRTAHYCGADVEAEIGELPNADISELIQSAKEEKQIRMKRHILLKRRVLML